MALSGRHSPFSNFHQANVQVNSQGFTWPDQYFQFKTAVIANDHQTQVRILVENNAARVKKLGDNIESTVHKKREEWMKKHTEDAMIKGLTESFPRMKVCVPELEYTGEKTMVEYRKWDKFCAEWT